MNAEGLLRKAVTALSSAKLLLHSGDADGACNRAYYTMFDAAPENADYPAVAMARFMLFRVLSATI